MSSARPLLHKAITAQDNQLDGSQTHLGADDFLEDLSGRLWFCDYGTHSASHACARSASRRCRTDFGRLSCRGAADVESETGAAAGRGPVLSHVRPPTRAPTPPSCSRQTPPHRGRTYITKVPRVAGLTAYFQHDLCFLSVSPTQLARFHPLSVLSYPVTVLMHSDYRKTRGS